MGNIWENIPFPWSRSSATSRIDDIDVARAEMCADMKEKHEGDFEHMKDCTKFMNKVCKKPRSPKVDDHCKRFFDEEEEKTTAAPTTVPPEPTHEPTHHPDAEEHHEKAKEHHEEAHEHI